MRKRIHKILITGGAGFIGSALVRLLGSGGLPLVVVDKLTYAGDLSRLNGIKSKFKFYKADICDRKKINRIFRQERPEIVVHLAAESHVDRSIKDASVFIDTNVGGTQVLLDAALGFGVKKFIFISTDEVYGEIPCGRFREDSPIKPNSPYAASKAAADLLVQSYMRTYGLPAIIVRPSNNYGPWQYPEKLIPLAILRICKGEKIPVYGQGKNVREWLYVDDCAKGILTVIKKGRVGQVYNLGSSFEKRNIDTIKSLLATLGVNKNRFIFVKDRPGHDIRYRLDSGKIRKETGWAPQIGFEDGLKLTVCWYLDNERWLVSKYRNVEAFYKIR